MCFTKYFMFSESPGYQLGDAMQQLGVGAGDESTPPGGGGGPLGGYANLLHHHPSQPPHYPQQDQEDYHSLGDPAHQPTPYFETSPELYSSGSNIMETKYHPGNYTKNYVRSK